MPVTNIYKGATGDPDGGGKDAERLGMNAVSRDIGRVYMDTKKLAGALKGRKIAPERPKSAAVSTVFTRMIKEGRIDRAQKVIRTVPQFASFEVIFFDGGKLHKQRQKNGRVHKNYKPKIVVDSPKLREYVEKQRAKVGWTKGAWINAAKQIPGSKQGRVNKWITKHNAAPSQGFFKMYGKAESKLTNNVDWIPKKIDDRRAMEAFDRRFKEDIDTRIQEILAKQQSQGAAKVTP